MTEANAHELPVLGSEPNVDGGGRGSSSQRQEDPQPSEESEATSSEDESFRALMLEHAEQFCAPEQGGSQCRFTHPHVAGALPPLLKKALHVLQDPQMFWEGSTPAVKTKAIKGKRHRRKRPKQKMPAGSLAHLSERCKEHPCVQDAIKEIEAGNQQLKLSLNQVGR